MRWIAFTLAGLLLLRADLSGAEVIHRCETAAGGIRYQQGPCSGALKSSGVRHYAPEPDSAPLNMASQSPERSGRAATRSRVRSREAPRLPEAAAGGAAGSCADVRAKRDEWERHAGLGRTYADLRRWNDAVARACR